MINIITIMISSNFCMIDDDDDGGSIERNAEEIVGGKFQVIWNICLILKETLKNGKRCLLFDNSISILFFFSFASLSSVKEEFQ